MVQDNKDGTYGVSYTPKEPGIYKVLVCVKEQHVQVSKTCADASLSSFHLALVGSVTFGYGVLSHSIRCTEGPNRILFFLAVLPFRNAPDFVTHSYQRMLVPKNSGALFYLWAVMLVFSHSPSWLVGTLNLGKMP